MALTAPELDSGSRSQFAPRPGHHVSTRERYPALESPALQSQTLAAGGRRVAVIGTGSGGKDLVRISADLGALRTVCDPDLARLALQPNGTVKHYGRMKDCLFITEDHFCFPPNQNTPPQRATYTGGLKLKRLADLVSLPTVKRCPT
jgi:hypothetical protein